MHDNAAAANTGKEESYGSKPTTGLSPYTARGVFFLGKQRVAVEEIALNPKPGEFELRSVVSAVSHGTEKLAYTGRLPTTPDGETLTALQTGYNYPLLYGYMNAGYLNDGTKVFSFQPHQDRLFVPEEELIRIPADIDLDDAVLLPSLETALGIVHDAELRFRESAAVVGLGVIGLLTVELLYACGAARVIACDPVESRRERAQALGAVTAESREELIEHTMQLTHGRGLDLTVNTSGAASGLQCCIEACAQEAQVIEASWYGRDETSLRLGGCFHRKRIGIKSSQVSHINPGLSARWSKERRIGEVLELLPRIRPSKYITHRFAMEDAAQAFELLASDRESLQIVFDFTGR